MFGASDTIKRIMNRLRMRPGDVTSEGWWFWREWFIVMGKVDGEPVGACVCSRNKTQWSFTAMVAKPLSNASATVGYICWRGAIAHRAAGVWVPAHYHWNGST
jgi:hypothetical protein